MSFYSFSIFFVPLIWFNLYGCQAVRRKLEKGLKIHFLCLTPFWAYFGQHVNHIGWATSMRFASIYPFYPKTNPWNFLYKKYWGLGELENALFWFLVIGFFKKKKNQMKISLALIWGIIYFCTMDGSFRILEKTSSELICTWL